MIVAGQTVGDAAIIVLHQRHVVAPRRVLVLRRVQLDVDSGQVLDQAVHNKQKKWHKPESLTTEIADVSHCRNHLV